MDSFIMPANLEILVYVCVFFFFLIYTLTRLFIFMVIHAHKRSKNRRHHFEMHAPTHAQIMHFYLHFFKMSCSFFEPHNQFIPNEYCDDSCCQ